MQNSATSGSQGMGVAVGKGIDVKGTSVAVGVDATDKVSDGATTAVGIETGLAAQDVRRNRKSIRIRFIW